MLFYAAALQTLNYDWDTLLGAAPKWNQRPEGRKTQFRES